MWCELLLSGWFLGATPCKTDEVEWQHDLAAGEAAAASTGKPLFIVFRCER